MRTVSTESQDGDRDGAGALASVAGHEELSGRLLALGVRDASDLPLEAKERA